MWTFTVRVRGVWKNTLITKDVKTLIENNGGLKSTLGTMLDQFATPSFRSKVFAIADALAGGIPAVISSGR